MRVIDSIEAPRRKQQGMLVRHLLGGRSLLQFNMLHRILPARFWAGDVGKVCEPEGRSSQVLPTPQVFY